jgi:hypothetical protein
MVAGGGESDIDRGSSFVHNRPHNEYDIGSPRKAHNASTLIFYLVIVGTVVLWGIRLLYNQPTILLTLQALRCFDDLFMHAVSFRGDFGQPSLG